MNPVFPFFIFFVFKRSLSTYPKISKRVDDGDDDDGKAEMHAIKGDSGVDVVGVCLHPRGVLQAS